MDGEVVRTVDQQERDPADSPKVAEVRAVRGYRRAQPGRLRVHGARCPLHPGPLPGCRSETRGMSTFAFRLIPPRPTFIQDMSDEERAVMERHAAHWQEYIASGRMVIFGPVLDGTGSWGLGVVEADSADEVRAVADSDPAVTSGTARIEVGELLTGFVRPG